MNEKTDGNLDFLSDDESGFEETPFAEVPFEGNQPAKTNPADDSSDGAVKGKAPQAESNVTDTETDSEEARKRAAHEAAETQRKAEFDARQEAKRKALQDQVDKVNTMSDKDVVNAAIQRSSADTEKLTRRNMKEMVTEHIQTLCFEDPGFARLTMHPRKNMIRCFQYINRMAYQYVQDEMKVSGFKPGAGMQTYGSDIPDDLCYQWAEDYFRNPNVKEDREEEEKFTPKAYSGKTASAGKGKKAASKKKEDRKPTAPKAAAKAAKPTADEAAEANGQFSMFGGQL